MSSCKWNDLHWHTPLLRLYIYLKVPLFAYRYDTYKDIPSLAKKTDAKNSYRASRLVIRVRLSTYLRRQLHWSFNMMQIGLSQQSYRELRTSHCTVLWPPYKLWSMKRHTNTICLPQVWETHIHTGYMPIRKQPLWEKYTSWGVFVNFGNI